MPQLTSVVEYFLTFVVRAELLASSVVMPFASGVASSTFVVVHSTWAVVSRGAIGKQAASLVVHI